MKKRRLFRLPRSAGTVQRDVDEEIAFHIEARIADLMSTGLGAAAAREQAEREFGDVSEARRELAAIDRTTLQREQRVEWWDTLVQDGRLALRGMARAPLFALTIVATLALGIGTTAMMFGLADALLLRPPPHVRDADKLVRVLYEQVTETGAPSIEASVSYPHYDALRTGVTGFSGAAAYRPPVTAVLGRGESATEVRLAAATATFFPLLGVTPAAGRFFTAEEDLPPRGSDVVVLGWGLWQRHFGGAASVIGSRIEIDHRSYAVVGVAPRGFTGMELEPVHAWLPVGTLGPRLAGDEWHTTPYMSWLRIVARLAPGAAVEPVRQQATSLFTGLHPERFERMASVEVVFGSAIVGRSPLLATTPAGERASVQRSGRVAAWLFGVSFLVLLIACANVANLLLARGMQRRREIGVRLALGVGRARLAGQALTETLLYAGAGAGAGLLIAHWGGHLARALMLPGADWGGPPVTLRVVLFAGAVALLATVATGVAPALHAVRGDAAGLLGGATRATYRRGRVRTGIVALQTTLTVVLLAGAGLFVRSLQEATAVRLGWEPERVVTFDWHSTGLGWDRQRLHDVYDASLTRVQGLPGVEAAAVSMTAPMTGALYGFIRVPGLDSIPPAPDGILYTGVSPDYFRTLGTRLIRGRMFDDGDVPGSAPVVIVTEAMARLLWPGEDAVGRCFVHLREEVTPRPCREIVGIVEDTRHGGLLATPSVMYFLPLAQHPGWAMRTLLVRLRDDAALGSVRDALQTLEPGLPRVVATPLAERMAPQLRPWRAAAAVFSGFGVLAALLAALGVFGVVGYEVVQRRRELGVRLALGARTQGLVRMVLGDALRVVVAGIVVGLALAGAAAPAVESLLFGVSPRDPFVFSASAALLLAVAMVAAAVPAWRAARAVPTDALREE